MATIWQRLRRYASFPQTPIRPWAAPPPLSAASCNSTHWAQLPSKLFLVRPRFSEAIRWKSFLASWLSRTSASGRYQSKTCWHRLATDHDGEAIKRDYTRSIGEIKEHLKNLTMSAESFNRELEGMVRGLVTKRKERLLADAGMVAALGLPIKKRHRKASDSRMTARAAGKSMASLGTFLAPWMASVNSFAWKWQRASRYSSSPGSC